MRNALAVVKGALRHLHGEPTIHDKVSGYYIAGEIGRTYEALAGMVPADQAKRTEAAITVSVMDAGAGALACGLPGAPEAACPGGGSGEVPQASPRAAHAGQPHVSTATPERFVGAIETGKVYEQKLLGRTR